MIRYHVFFQDKLIRECEFLPDVVVSELPLGAYIWSHRGKWYQVSTGGVDVQVATLAVPKTIRTLALLLNL